MAPPRCPDSASTRCAALSGRRAPAASFSHSRHPNQCASESLYGIQRADRFARPAPAWLPGALCSVGQRDAQQSGRGFDANLREAPRLRPGSALRRRHYFRALGTELCADTRFLADDRFDASGARTRRSLYQRVGRALPRQRRTSGSPRLRSRARRRPRRRSCSEAASMSRPTPLSTLPLPDTRGYEAAPASHARASTNAGLDPRVATHLLVATSRAAVADGATPLLPEPRWALPTNSPQDRRRPLRRLGDRA